MAFKWSRLDAHIRPPSLAGATKNVSSFGLANVLQPSTKTPNQSAFSFSLASFLLLFSLLSIVLFLGSFNFRNTLNRIGFIVVFGVKRVKYFKTEDDYISYKSDCHHANLRWIPFQFINMSKSIFMHFYIKTVCVNSYNNITSNGYKINSVLFYR